EQTVVRSNRVDREGELILRGGGEHHHLRLPERPGRPLLRRGYVAGITGVEQEQLTAVDLRQRLQVAPGDSDPLYHFATSLLIEVRGQVGMRRNKVVIAPVGLAVSGNKHDQDVVGQVVLRDLLQLRAECG